MMEECPEEEDLDRNEPVDEPRSETMCLVLQFNEKASGGSQQNSSAAIGVERVSSINIGHRAGTAI
jgi:hypothetical protein